MHKIDIKILVQIADLNKYKEIVNEIPIFATQNFADYLMDYKNINTYWLYAKDKNKTNMLIPISITKKGIFKKGQLLTNVLSLEENISLSSEKCFLDNIILFLKNNKMCHFIIQAPNWAIFKSYPDNAYYCEFGTYKLNLEKNTIESLFNNIEKKDRYDIRYAINAGVIIKKGKSYRTKVLEIINCKLINEEIKPVETRDINSLEDNLKDGITYYMAVDSSGIPQAGAIFLNNKYCAFNYLAGTANKPIRGSNTLLYWEAIKDFKENGVKQFDFVGARINPPKNSKYERIQRFKKHFGPELYKGYIWKVPISRFYYNLYNFLLYFLYFFRNGERKYDIIDQEIKRKEG